MAKGSPSSTSAAACNKYAPAHNALMGSGHAIQGVKPARVLAPADIKEYAGAVGEICRAGGKIADYGTAHEGLGHSPPLDHVRIIPPAGVIEHYVPDMAVRVAGGTALGDLQRALGEHRQHLPLDGADGSQTIAELIAHDVSGPLRLAHGTMRDLLLGLRYADPAGQLITVGGRTVKNVAGYDVTRLMVGNLNTLGLIAEATLRTTAIPRRVTRATLTDLDPAVLDGRLTDLLTSDAAPFYLDWQSIRAEGGEVSHALHIAYAGTPTGCAAQHEALLAWLRDNDFAINPALLDVDLAGDAADRAARRAWRLKCRGLVKIIVPPASTGRTVNALLGLAQPPHTLDTLPGHGVIHLGADWSADQARAADAALLDLLRPHAGLRAWLRRPDHTPTVPPLAPDPPDLRILQRIQHAMDPADTFNPGRWLTPPPG